MIVTARPLSMDCSSFPDYWPFASTVQSIVDLFHMYVVLPQMARADIQQSPYYTQLQHKHPLRSVFLLIPLIGNLIIALYDFSQREHTNKARVMAAINQAGGARDAYTKAHPLLQNDRQVALAAVGQDFTLFSCVPLALKEDLDFVKEAALLINRNSPPSTFSPRPTEDVLRTYMRDHPTFRADLAAAINLVKLNGRLLPLLSDEMRDDPEVIRWAVWSAREAFLCASLRRRENREFVASLVYGNADVLSYTGPQFRDDLTFVVEAIERAHLPCFAGLVFNSASERLRNDPYVAALASRKSGFMSRSLCNNLNFMLSLVRQGSEIFAMASDDLRNNLSFAIAAAKRGDRLSHLGPQLLANQAEMRRLLAVHGDSLREAAALQDDEEAVLAAVTSCGSAIQFASPRLKEVERIAFAAVRNDGNAIQFLSPALQVRLAREAVERTPSALQHLPELLPEHFQCDEEIIRAAIPNFGWALRHLLPSLFNPGGEDLTEPYNNRDIFESQWMAGRVISDNPAPDRRELALTAAKNNGAVVRFLPRYLRYDREIARAAVLSCGRALHWLPPCFRESLEFVTLALRMRYKKFREYEDIYANLPVAMREDPETALSAIEANSDIFVMTGVHDRFSSNPRFPDFTERALARNPEVFKWVSLEMRNTPDLALSVVRRKGSLLQFASERLRDHEPLVEAALVNDGLAIQHASLRLRRSPQMALRAVQQNGLALEYLHPDALTSEVLEAALTNTPFAIRFVAFDHPNYRTFALRALRQDRSVFKWLYPDTQIALREEIAEG